MVKIFLVVFFVFNALACKPVKQVSEKNNAKLPNSFSCISSQNQCEVNAGFGRFSIQFSGEISQGRIKTELPFFIQVKLKDEKEGNSIQKIESYLEGKDMFMGKIPVFFKLNENQPSVMTADSLLANCSEEVMTWRLWLQTEVVINDKTEQQRFFIDFESERL